MALEHRFRDEEDWWIDDSQLVREINRGDGIFISTGVDGYHEVLLRGKGSRIGGSVISMNLIEPNLAMVWVFVSLGFGSSFKNRTLRRCICACFRFNV